MVTDTPYTLWVVAVQDAVDGHVKCWGFPDKEAAAVFMRRVDESYTVHLTLQPVSLSLSEQDGPEIPDPNAKRDRTH